MHTPLKLVALVRGTLAGWSRGQAGLNAAALAFFALLSLAPMVSLTVAIMGQAVQKPQVEAALVRLAERRAGHPAALLVHDTLRQHRTSHTTGVAAVVSIVLLIFGASTVVLQVRAATNVMWGLAPAGGSLRGVALAQVRARLSSAILTVGVGLGLLALFAVNTLTAAIYAHYLRSVIPDALVQSKEARDIITLAGFVALFTIAFMLIPQASMRLRDLLPGAAVTALLFWLGTRVVGVYLDRVAARSAYGAAGSVMVFLLWVYYSAMIYLLGARFAAVWATMFGAGIQPGPGMQLTPEALAGMAARSTDPAE